MQDRDNVTKAIEISPGVDVRSKGCCNASFPCLLVSESFNHIWCRMVLWSSHPSLLLHTDSMNWKMETTLLLCVAMAQAWISL